MKGDERPVTSQAACTLSAPFYLEGMSEHKMTLTWKRGDLPFEYQKYSRNHTWKFDGGHEMTASAAPTYLGDPKNVDPEEAFVASLAARPAYARRSEKCRSGGSFRAIALRLPHAHLSRDRM